MSQPKGSGGRKWVVIGVAVLIAVAAPPAYYSFILLKQPYKQAGLTDRQVSDFIYRYGEQNGNSTWVEFAKAWASNQTLADRSYITFRRLEDSLSYISSTEDTELAIETLDKYGTDAPKALLLEKAEALYRRQMFTEAIAIYQEVYEAYPDWQYAEVALMMIGICYYSMGQNQTAIQYYQEAILMYPDLKQFLRATYFYLGVAYYETGQKENAIEAFIDSIGLFEETGLDPNALRFLVIEYYYLGLAYYDTGQKETALEAFKNSVEFCQETGLDPNAFPYKDAREWVAKLETEG